MRKGQVVTWGEDLTSFVLMTKTGGHLAARSAAFQLEAASFEVSYSAVAVVA
jgi:hypothetical protein